MDGEVAPRDRVVYTAYGRITPTVLPDHLQFSRSFLTNEGCSVRKGA